MALATRSDADLSSMLSLPSDAVVLVTGGSGFLGRHLLARLQREGCEIHGVSRERRGPRSDRITWHNADLRNSEEAQSLVGRIRPTHLLHGAWIATPGRYSNDAENIEWLQAGLALLRAFGEAGGRRFVGIGTCFEYDWNWTRFVEDETPSRPNTLYGKAKAAMAASAEAFAARFGFLAAWGRVFLPYGPGDSDKRLIPSVIQALRRGQPVELTHGQQERDFIFATDIADLFWRLLVGAETGYFNVGTGRGTSVRSAVEFVGDRLGQRELLRFGARATVNSEPARLVADMSKVNKTLGWTAATPIESGLAEMVDRALSKPPEASRL